MAASLPCLGSFVRAWEAAQVELHGDYSPSRLCALHRYTRGPHRASSWRMLAVIVLTPVPSLLSITLPEMFSLNPPFDGLERNYGFYGRMYMTFLVFCSLLTQQASARLPALPLTRLQGASIAAGIATGIVAINFLLAQRIGFPLPFTIQLSTPTHFSLMTLALAVLWRRHFGEAPSVASVANASMIFVCQAIAISVYPLYYYAFTCVPPGSGRVAFSMLLPVLKLAFRNLFSSFCVRGDDTTPPIVVFNADVGNALFVTYCLQYSPSMATTFGLMAANAAQVAFSINDVNAILANLATISAQIEMMRRAAAPPSTERSLAHTGTGGHEADDMMEQSMDILTRLGCIVPSPLGVSSSSLRSFVVPIVRAIGSATLARHVQVAPMAPHVDLIGARRKGSLRTSGPRRSTSNLALRLEGQAAQLERLERQYTNQVRKLLHVTEYSILIEYAEVIIPFVYSLYLVIMYQMPNRAYYSQFADMDAAKIKRTVTSVLLYSLVELLSLVVLDRVLKHKLRFSTLRQLAFVLDRQSIHVQSALVIWVFYTTQVSLDHFGADYSFKFEWLHKDASQQVAVTS